MRKLEDSRSASRRANDEIIDAEFIDIDDKQSGRRSASRPVPRRRVAGCFGLLLKIIGGLALAGIALMIIAVAFAPAEDPSQQSNEFNGTGPAVELAGSETGEAVGEGEEVTLSIAADWLVGSWVLAPKGGTDGLTECGDFVAPSLYRLNGNTGRLVSFDNPDRYRDIFVYTTPSDEVHTTQTRARWNMLGMAVQLSGMTVRDAFVTTGGSEVRPVIPVTQNVIMIGEAKFRQRYVRCIGDVDQIFGD